jgi:hypothetical protein
MQIPGADAAGGQRGVSACFGSDKGKVKVLVSEPTIRVGSQPPLGGGGASSASTAPPEKKSRLFHSDGSTVGWGRGQGSRSQRRLPCGSVTS